MRELFSEIIKELKKSLKSFRLRHKWIMRIAAVIAVLAIVLLLKVVLYPAVKTGELINSSTQEWTDTVNLFDNIKSGEVVSTSESSSDIETSLKLFFVGANESSLDMFSSVIDPERLSHDFLLKYDFDELISKYNEAMVRLSRNGQIESVNIINSNRIIGANRRVVFDIKYEDKPNPIRANVEFKVIKEEESHDEETATYKQPLISSSIWSLIEFLEQGGNN